ncbi:MAG: metallophosphoesterase [Thermoplasmata archaeon]
MIYPVLNERALYDESMKLMIIADLHLGIEAEFENRGILIPDQSLNILDRILRLIEAHEVRTLIILGDVKHTLYYPDYRDKSRLSAFFHELSEKASIEIVPGNHDGSLKRMYPELNVRSSRGILFGPYYLMHGHTWPTKELEKARYLVMAHIHPEIRITDAQGHNQVEPCWLRGNPEKKMENYYDFNGEVIIMPSFNTLTGRALSDEKDTIGPLFANGIVKIAHMNVYLLDGTNLGKAIKKF